MWLQTEEFGVGRIWWVKGLDLSVLLTRIGRLTLCEACMVVASVCFARVFDQG